MKFASIVSVTSSAESDWTKISAENFWILSCRADAGAASATTSTASSAALRSSRRHADGGCSPSAFDLGVPIAAMRRSRRS